MNESELEKIRQELLRLRAELQELDENCRRWNVLYSCLEAELRKIPGLSMPHRPQHEQYVGSSIQFSFPDFSEDQMRDFVENCGIPAAEAKTRKRFPTSD